MQPTMTADEYKAQVRAGWTEAEFLVHVRTLARECGWMEHHHYDARRSTAGVPDLILVRPASWIGTGRRLIVAELKVGSNTLTAAQEMWLNALNAAGVMAVCWRPQNWEMIEAILRQGEP